MFKYGSTGRRMIRGFVTGKKAWSGDQAFNNEIKGAHHGQDVPVLYLGSPVPGHLHLPIHTFSCTLHCS